MADSLAFGEYKIGGISAALGKELDAANKKESSKQLKALFDENKESSFSVFHDESETRKGGGTTGKKRGHEGNSDGQPSRKKQRENRKVKKLKKKLQESEGLEKNDKSLVAEEGEEQENEGKLPDKDDPERLSRTVFVGNIQVKTTRKEIKELFKVYGLIETVRLRSVPVTSAKHPKKVSIIKKEFNPDCETMNAYVVFKNKDDAKNALKKNGEEYKGFHMRVSSAEKQVPDNRLSIFVGNLPFNIQEEHLWKHFSGCGEIQDVRVVRDQKSGIGKGFAYVAFKKKESVTFALKMRNSELLRRNIRVFPAVSKDSVKEPFNKKKDRNYRMRDTTSKDGKKSKGSIKKKPGSENSFAGKKSYRERRPNRGMKNQSKNKDFNKKRKFTKKVTKKK